MASEKAAKRLNSTKVRSVRPISSEQLALLREAGGELKRCLSALVEAGLVTAEEKAFVEDLHESLRDSVVEELHPITAEQALRMRKRIASFIADVRERAHGRKQSAALSLISFPSETYLDNVWYVKPEEIGH